MPQLYYFETINPRKTCATAKHLGVPLEYVKLDLRKREQRGAEHLARNPNGKVPVLVDGDMKLWESAAIMAWLATRAGSDMWPARDPERLVDVLRWVHWDAAHFSAKAAVFYGQRVIRPRLGLGATDEAAIAAATPAFHDAAKVLDTHLAGREFVAGRTVTIADFCLAAALPYAEEADLPIADYTQIRRWHDRLMQIPAWRDPWPA
jgi:glutathione S-transferase